MEVLHFLVSQQNIFIFAVALTSGLMLAWPILTRSSNQSLLTPSAAIQLVNRQHAVWIDIRPIEQFQTGHIAQARSLPLNELEQKISTLPAKKPLVVVCAHGNEAKRAVTKLKEKGYDQVFILEGGMNAWVNNALPTTKKV